MVKEVPGNPNNNAISGADRGDHTTDKSKPGASSSSMDVIQAYQHQPPEQSTSGPSKIDKLLTRYRDGRQSLSSEENVDLSGGDGPNAPKQTDKKGSRPEWVKQLQPSYHTLRIKHEHETTRLLLITELRRELDTLATQMIQQDSTSEQEIRQIAMRTEQEVWNRLKPKASNVPLGIKMAISTMMEAPQTPRPTSRRLVNARKTDDRSTVKREIRFQPTENQQKFMDQLVKQLDLDAPTAAHNDFVKTDFTIKQWDMLNKIKTRLYREARKIREEDPHNEDLQIKAETQALQILKYIRRISYEAYYNGTEGSFEQELQSMYSDRRPNDGLANKRRSETQRSEDTIRTRLEAVLGETLDLDPFSDKHADPTLRRRPPEPPLHRTLSSSSDSSNSLHSESSTDPFGDEYVDPELTASVTRRRPPEPPLRRTSSSSSDSSSSLNTERVTNPFGDEE